MATDYLPSRFADLLTEGPEQNLEGVHAVREKSSGVADGVRTHDNRNHNPGLYR